MRRLSQTSVESADYITLCNSGAETTRLRVDVVSLLLYK